MRFVYPSFIWDLPGKDKKIYLSFDDGPHPEITPWVLDQLTEHNAKASFFCIGKNVAQYPAVYERIVNDGHAVGNHTYNHLNGWKSEQTAYWNNIELAEKQIASDLFRPPYGKIKRSQAKELRVKKGWKIVMWTVLSGDFDKEISSEKCLQNVLGATRAGSIVVFHDSEKAWNRLAYALPKVLDFFAGEGYSFEKIVI